MFSRKIIAAATLSAAALFLGPVAVASAAGSPTTGLGAGSAGSSSGSAGSSSGSAGSSSGSAMLGSGSSALDDGTHAMVNILDLITGVNNLSQPKPAS
ncbi:hypothetical protein ACIRRA_38450 [Nocardia sp. NPDC101769]|uniref:hypothetical protein n=1 Tax=Nocardia sp. NPDC101769 TaxID=3364333 RepID=UPI003802D877